MPVVGLFKCSEIVEYESAQVTDDNDEYWGGYHYGRPDWFDADKGLVNVTVKLGASRDRSTPQLESFSVASPQGTIELMIQNPDAARFFKAGKVYKVTFTELRDRDLKDDPLHTS